MEYVTPACSMLALFLAYFAISREGRADLKDFLGKALALARKGLRPILIGGIIIVPALISWNSYTNILTFRDSIEPITRGDIISLLLHAFNFGIYLIFCMAAIGIAIGLYLPGGKKNKKDKDSSDETITPNENIPESSN